MKYGIDFIGVFVAGICFDRDGNFLMGKRGGEARDRHGEWEFPGGGVELGETYEAALVREIREECGTEPSNIERIEVIEFLERGMHYYGFYCVADIDRDAVNIAEPVYDEFGWFTFDTIPSTVNQHYINLLQKAVVAHKAQL